MNDAALLLEKKNRALEMLNQGLAAEARSLFHEVCETETSDIGARYMLAVAETQLGNYGEAEASIRKVIEAMPDMADAYFLLGQTLQGQKKFEASIESFGKALSIQPHMAEVLYSLGSVQHTTGNRQSALESYNQALRINPNHVDALTNQGIIYRELGNLDEAETRFRSALDIRPDLDHLRGVLGVTLVQNGKADAGLKMLHQGLHIQSDSIVSLTVPVPDHRIIDPDKNRDTFTSLPQITIATSLAPSNFENQKAALDSWKQLGFDVVSINSEAEIQVLTPHFEDINFITATRHAGKESGKPYIYFDDFLAYFEKSSDKICGILNSDIHLTNNHLKTLVSVEAPDSFLFGCRLDVDSLTTQQGNIFVDGFDYFFFDRKFINVYLRNDFCLGLPWWDYWAVIVPMLNKVPVKKLISPVAHHISHPINWDDKNWRRLGYKVGEYIGMPAQPTVQMLGYCARYLVFLIEKYSQKISLAESTSNDEHIARK